MDSTALGFMTLKFNNIMFNKPLIQQQFFNRHVVAGAVLQAHLLPTDSFIKSWFVEISSVHLQSQTEIARELKF